FPGMRGSDQSKVGRVPGHYAQRLSLGGLRRQMDMKVDQTRKNESGGQIDHLYRRVRAGDLRGGKEARANRRNPATLNKNALPGERALSRAGKKLSGMNDRHLARVGGIRARQHGWHSV